MSGDSEADDADAVWVDADALCGAANAIDTAIGPIAEPANLVAPSVSVATATETLSVLATFVNNLGPVLGANLALLARATRVGALEPILADASLLLGASCAVDD